MTKAGLKVAVVGAALALLSTPAYAAKSVTHYTSPAEACTFYDAADYAPHGYAVCSKSAVTYKADRKSGKVRVAGSGTTDFTFDAGVYQRTHVLNYSFKFVVNANKKSHHEVKAYKNYQVAYGEKCTFFVDFTFVKGVLKTETASNVCK